MTPHRPTPSAGGGAAHELELLRLASRHHDIEVLSSDLPPGQIDLDTGEAEVPASGVAWRARLGASNRATFALQLARAWPTHGLWVAERRLPVLRHAIRAREAADEFDLIHFTSSELAPLVAACRAPTAVLVFDVFSRHCRREAEVAHTVERKLRWQLETLRMTRWERRWLSRFDAIGAVSDVDAAVLEQRISRPVAVIPNPVPDTYFDRPAAARTAGTVAFVANLAYRPNVDAVEWFTQEIWPLVRREVPDAELEIVGAQPTPEVVRAAERAGARLFADVGDVRPHYWRAAVAVAPIRLGAGLRNEVLHAMACEAPVVATSAASEGIDVVHEQHLLIADEPAAFAAAVVSTLRNKREAAARSAAARRFVDRYRAEAVGAQFDAWWQTTCRSSRPRTSSAQKPSRTVTPPRSGSVVVCTRDRPDLLRHSLKSVARSTAGDVAEIVIVEQGQESAAATCAALGVDAQVVHDDGTGASRARNIGAQRASGDVLLFTDDDCEVPPTWVTDHLQSFADARVVGSFGVVEGLSRFSMRGLSGGDMDPVAWPARHSYGTAPWLIGHSANMAVRRSSFLAAGGFDERLGPGTAGGFIGEDADLIVRLLEGDGIGCAGVGEPVQHTEWRSSTQTAENLIAYEKGAGAWIGKLLRRDRQVGRRLLVARVDLLRTRVRAHAGDRAERRVVLSSIAGFVRGLVFGVRLR